MNSRERVLATVSGDLPVDRIPVFLAPSGVPPESPALGELSALVGTQIPESRNLVILRRELAERGDLAYMTRLPAFDRRFLLVSDEYISREETWQDDILHVLYSVETPRGTLTCKEQRRVGLDTTWVVEPLLKEEQDIEKILSVPWSVEENKIESSVDQTLRLLKDRETWVHYVFISTPMVCVSHLLPMDVFLEWSLARPDLMHQLISTACERIRLRLNHLLSLSFGDIYRFGGSEQATPPLMSPRQYDEYVVRYDRALFESVRSAGKLVQVHCHGKVRDILTKMLEMGVNATDPLEPPPQGDVVPSEAFRISQGRIAMIGNLEFRDLECRSPEEIAAMTRDVLDQTGGHGTILASSADPDAGISDRLLSNYRAMLDAAHEFRPA